MKNLDIRSKKRVAINRVMVGLQRAQMWEFRQNDKIIDYLSARLAILELS